MNKAIKDLTAISIIGIAMILAIILGRQLIYPRTLRMLADQKNILIGAAVNGWLLSDPDYSVILANEFSLITPENALKFGPLCPEPGVYLFDEADAIIAFANSHQMFVRGHTLVWTNQLPDWLTSREWTRDELLEILYRHITTVVGRYQDSVYAWDVVNEALANDGTIALDNFWMKGIGPDYIELAFRWAHATDPNALLFYNDSFAEGMGEKSNGIYAMVADLLERGVPIHGVGLEMHVGVDYWLPPYSEISANIHRLSDLGLQVHITELDVRLPTPITKEYLEQQATIYGGMLSVCLEQPACTAFGMWGFTDAHSWIPYIYPEWTAPLIFDEVYKPKPAYWALIETLESK